MLFTILFAAFVFACIGKEGCKDNTFLKLPSSCGQKCVGEALLISESNFWQVLEAGKGPYFLFSSNSLMDFYKKIKVLLAMVCIHCNSLPRTHVVPLPTCRPPSGHQPRSLPSCSWQTCASVSTGHSYDEVLIVSKGALLVLIINKNAEKSYKLKNFVNYLAKYLAIRKKSFIFAAQKLKTTDMTMHHHHHHHGNPSVR